MRVMDINDAKAFIAVVDSGSVSRAANELHLTQPAVTRRVQRFEQAVGTPLIDRRRRPFALTEAGREAMERCRRLVAAADELRALSQGDQMPSREARIGVAHALSETVMSHPVDRLREDYPSVVLRLHTGWSRELVGRVRSGMLDAAVIFLPSGEDPRPPLAGEVLGEEHLSIVSARRRGWTAGSIRDLEGASWVLCPDGCAARTALQREMTTAGLPLRVGVETYNYELQLDLIARARGLGLVPDRLLARSAARSQLRKLAIPGLEFPLKIWMVAGELPVGLAPPVRSLAGFLRRELSPSRRHAA
jgi:DNA-binding transcriptional LysR family regulator